MTLDKQHHANVSAISADAPARRQTESRLLSAATGTYAAIRVDLVGVVICCEWYAAIQVDIVVPSVDRPWRRNFR